MIAPAAPAAPAASAASSAAASRPKKERGHLFGNAGFTPRDRRRLCRAIRAGVSRQELLAVVLCRFDGRSRHAAAAILRTTVPTVRDLLASFRTRERAARADRDQATRVARRVEAQDAADPIRATCKRCGERHRLMPGDPPTCQGCLEPLPLSDAQRVALLPRAVPTAAAGTPATPPAEPQPTAPTAPTPARPSIRAVIVKCAGCGAGYLMGLRVTRKCGECGAPLRLTAADRRTIKANVAARAAAGG